MRILSRRRAAATAGVAAALIVLLPTAASATLTSRVTTDTCEAAARHGFADVVSTSVHSDAIACLRHFDVTVGTTTRTFQPGANLTRGQLASFLARTLDASDVALPAATRHYFTDTAGSVHEEAIDRLARAGIVPTTSSTFGLHRTVDRAEMAQRTAAALRFAGVLSTTSVDYFTDDAGLAAEAAINQLAHAGVVAGRTTGQFAPRSLLRRDQMASFLTRALDLIVDRGSVPEGRPEVPRVLRSSEGWVVAGWNGPTVGTGGTTTRYTVEIADGLHQRQDLTAFRDFVESTLSDRSHGWTARGAYRLQRVEKPADARVRVVLASPATVDRLCAQAGLNTAGIYSCWNGRVAAINADRWFQGVAHVRDMSLYRTYVINHEVGHGLGQGHRSCPGTGRLAPVMMQLSKSTYGCVPNGLPYP